MWGPTGFGFPSRTVAHEKERAEKLNLNAGMQMLAGGGVLAALLLFRSQYERNSLSVEQYTVNSPKVKGGPKTFVFLTDLHNKEFGKGNERLLSAVREVKPDAVLIGGDSIIARGDKGEVNLKVSLECIRALALEFPVFCGNGNHEGRLRRDVCRYGSLYREYCAKLEEAGAVCLCNDKRPFGDDFMIWGLDLPPEKYHGRNIKLEDGFLERTLGKAQGERFHILLAHSPCFFKEYADWGADLALAGHFHGGTIRLPFVGGLMTPQYQFFYPWCAGLFTARSEFSSCKKGTENSRMLVGRGLGTHSVNIRLGNKPQVVVVKIQKEPIF